MKRILTFLFLSFFVVGASAQNYLLTIDSVFIHPTIPVQGDSVHIYFWGQCSKSVAPESAPFIGNNGHEHTYSLCYLVDEALNTPTTIRDSATFFYAAAPGTDTIIWMLFHNPGQQNFCDAPLASDTFYVQIAPTGIATHPANTAQLNWDMTSSTLQFYGFSGAVTAEVFDVNGRSMQRSRSGPFNSIPLVGLSTGMYVVYVSDERGNSLRDKIFVR